MCREREVTKFLYAEDPPESFQEFRLKLIGLTKAAANYFEKLVRALDY